MMKSSRSQSRPTNGFPPVMQQNVFVYTYQLPYGIRRDFCNLLDADQSWRMLGGQFIGLDGTQLALIGQAILRNGSPTEELLNRLDSANMPISELCVYLQQMSHWRALDLLKQVVGLECDQPPAPTGPSADPSATMDTGSVSAAKHQALYQQHPQRQQQLGEVTLDTPTPSFADQPAAIMGANPADAFELDWLAEMAAGEQQQRQVEEAQQPSLEPQQPHRPNNQMNQLSPPSKCHNKQPQQSEDPGEEIVRLACASNRKRTSISDQDVVNQLRLIMQINYTELKQASDNFSDANILGNGGFASVYRGHWKGTDVAIKRLKCNLMDQALNELTILNSYRIDNILPIYGISIDGPEACLVYQFMANGSLEDRLACKQASRPLSWAQRALISEGVAKGLYYLHTLRDKPLVHGDVKSANVLLDAQLVPKLGDFGLARQVFRGARAASEQCTHCTVSSIHGTSVYLPPEYLRHKILSPAVDVYSYGIVLLEMATGRRAYDGKRLLIELVEDETSGISMGQISYSLKDWRLADDSQSELRIWFELLIKLGLECAHKLKRRRPDMGQLLAKFADFRARQQGAPGADGASAGELGQDGEPLNWSAGTARTLTPEPSALRQQQQLQCQHRQLHLQPHQLANQAQVSAQLMSVDERAQDEQQQREQTDAQVEAMIPLLTELGVVGEQPLA